MSKRRRETSGPVGASPSAPPHQRAKNDTGGAPAPLSPGLYVTATPIGHLKDITLRALEVLNGAGLILCEDTRVSGTLLSHYGINTACWAYHDHNAERMRPKILAALDTGKAVALISDAGTPLISDPGYKLVRAAVEAGHRVVPIPGASAALSALSVAGLPTDRFFFAGFPPVKEKARAGQLRALAPVPGTLIFYERARRLPAALTEMAAAFPHREAVIARELTKRHEEIRRGGLADLAAHYAEAGAPKGEVVILIGPPQAAEAMSEADLDAALRDALAGQPLRDAVNRVTAETGLPRRQVYQRALALKDDGCGTP